VRSVNDSIHGGRPDLPFCFPYLRHRSFTVPLFFSPSPRRSAPALGSQKGNELFLYDPRVVAGLNREGPLDHDLPQEYLLLVDVRELVRNRYENQVGREHAVKVVMRRPPCWADLGLSSMFLSMRMRPIRVAQHSEGGREHRQVVETLMPAECRATCC